jgi:GT2 family glycosyltransferase
MQIAPLGRTNSAFTGDSLLLNDPHFMPAPGISGLVSVIWEQRGERPATSVEAHAAELLKSVPQYPEGMALAPIAESVGRQSKRDESERRVIGAATQSNRIRSASLIRFPDARETGLVSVVIPTYNRAHIIGRAIESALGQTYAGVQVVIADDGSFDNTRGIAESYGPRVTYVRQANAGVSAARNFGMRYARGEFTAFLDSDDVWRPWKIEAQVAALARHPDAGVVWTDMAAVDEADRLIESRHLRVMYSAYENVDIEKTLSDVDTLGMLTAAVPHELASAAVREGDLFSAILLGNLIHTSTVLFRRSWCEKTGGFDESFARAGEDYEFYIRLCSAGPAVFIDAPSTLYRIGAADQLTAPGMMLEIARNDLRAIQKWVPQSGSQIKLSPSVIRRRFAESFAWVGEAELDAGHPWTAARRFSDSLTMMPGLDRRAVLLASCALPRKVRDGLRSARRAILSDDTTSARPSA